MDLLQTKPDYARDNIVNLVASLAKACGADTGLPELGGESFRTAANRRRIVLIVLDGLGYFYLQQHPASFLYRHLAGKLGTVFPSTTATAISTYVSGLTPQQHGLTGWFTHLKELGGVAAVLPFCPRHGGPSYRELGIDPRIIFDWSPLFDRLSIACHIVLPHSIAHSAYSEAVAGTAKRYGYDSLEDFFRVIGNLLGDPADRSYIYAYWSRFDTICHQFGVNSDEARDHFMTLDAGLAAFLAQHANDEVLFVISADHGFIDIEAENVLQLAAHPELDRCLALPLCGEPRVAFCYLRSGREQYFVDYVHNELAKQCCVVPSHALYEAGYFGIGQAHARFLERIGDYTLVMEPGFVIKDRLANENLFRQRGIHGGLTAEEMTVPLVIVGG